MRVADARVPIVVALSGGVDSAVAAALLAEQGARVVGIAMRLFDASGTAPAGRGAPQHLDDARNVCAHLGIPFYVTDFEADFRRAVIDYFVAEYQRGRTPNPCVRCNQYLKFAGLLRRAQGLGAAALATGHYARVVERDGRRLLQRGADRARDQSYFLFTLGTEALSFVRFPLGELTKEEVRDHARRLQLPVAEKAKSQEICFVPAGGYTEFIAAQRPGESLSEPGEIVDDAGQVLGHHQGVHRYTVGQRHGLGLAFPEPRYVTRIDAESRRLTVGPATALLRDRLTVGETSWPGGAPSEPFQALVQIRYRHAAAPATVCPQAHGRAEVVFEQPERAVAPGQAAVFYDGDLVVGGGFIE